MNNKNINELTEKEAKEILQFVYPNDKNFCFMDIALKSKINKDGSQQVTFSLRSIIGIKYHNGVDNCILHFDNTKVLNEDEYKVTDTTYVSKNVFGGILEYDVIVEIDSSYYFGSLNPKKELIFVNPRKLNYRKK